MHLYSLLYGHPDRYQFYDLDPAISPSNTETLRYDPATVSISFHAQRHRHYKTEQGFMRFNTESRKSRKAGSAFNLNTALRCIRNVLSTSNKDIKAASVLNGEGEQQWLLGCA